MCPKIRVTVIPILLVSFLYMYMLCSELHPICQRTFSLVLIFERIKAFHYSLTTPQFLNYKRHILFDLFFITKEIVRVFFFRSHSYFKLGKNANSRRKIKTTLAHSHKPKLIFFLLFLISLP